MKLFDAHTHIENNLQDWIALIRDQDLALMASVTRPEEWAELSALSRNQTGLYGSFGLHPWLADRYTVKELLPCLKEARAIGEIGMDAAWCRVDRALQCRVFLEQLAVAGERGCPVVLHTKGCEEEIMSHIRGMPGPFLVHWYSQVEYLERYLDMDCYFTIGPDVRSNPAVSRVAQMVPPERLMVESDGLSGVRWATGQKVGAGEIGNVLLDTISYIAELRGENPEALRRQTVENACRFYGISEHQDS